MQHARGRMFPSRHPRSFPRRPGAVTAGQRARCFSRRPMQGSVSGRHPSPHRGFEPSSSPKYRKVRAGGPTSGAWTGGFTAGRNRFLRSKEVRRPNTKPALLLHPRHQRLDGVRLGRALPKIEYARKPGPGRSATWPSSRANAVGVSCVAERGGARPCRRRATRPTWARSSTCWNRPSRNGETRLASVLARAGRDHSGSGGARPSFCRDLFIEAGATSGGCFQHLRFPQARRGRVSICSDPQEGGLRTSGGRRCGFLDMEGGPAIFAEPNDIADRLP